VSAKKLNLRDGENTRGLRYCVQHPVRIWFEGDRCPACLLIKEIPCTTRAKLYKQGKRWENEKADKTDLKLWRR